MKFESAPVPEQEKEKAPFPQAEFAIEAYLKEYEGQEDQAEIIRDVLNEFILDEMENSGLFEAGESGFEMPYTSINVANLARRIYRKTTGQEPSEATSKEELKKKQKFILGTSPALEDGDQFTTVEYAMHDVVKKLPAVLEKIKNGEALDDEEIFTIGMPTNVLGKIPLESVDKIADQPFDEFGKAYAEFIASQVKEEVPDNIEILGMSMGANFAIRAGEKLMDDGVVTQDHEEAKENNLPFLQIRTDVPVSLGESSIKKLQIPLGFVADGALEATRSDVRGNIFGSAGKEFKSYMRGRMAEKGIEPQMSPEQSKAKNTIIRKIIFGLGKGLELRPDTKITSVYGLKDLTSVTPGLRREAREQKEEHEGTLGESIIGRRREKERRHVANMLHLNPWYQKNELRRLDKLAETIKDLKQLP